MSAPLFAASFHESAELQRLDQINESLFSDLMRFRGKSTLFCLRPWSNFLDMRRNRFSTYLTLQALVIGAVMILFKFIADRQIAATVAGVLFVGLPLGLMAYEFKQAQFKQKLWFLGTLQFWVLFALPILGLRIFNWGVEFQSLSVFGVPGPLLHQWSSKSYMLWMVVTLITSWQVAKTKKAGE